MRYLAEEIYPEAERVRRLGCDNLSTHSPAAFYEIFLPGKARRLAEKAEFIFAPVHRSWPNIVEIDIFVSEAVPWLKTAWQLVTSPI